MRILVMNVNTSPTMTDVIGAAARLGRHRDGRVAAVFRCAPPDPKDITGWPLSAALGLHGGTGAGYGTAPGR